MATPERVSPRASSPCIQVCVMDDAAGLCTGCGRTLDEIRVWPRLSEAERQAIMRELADRMRRVLAPEKAG